MQNSSLVKTSGKRVPDTVTDPNRALLVRRAIMTILNGGQVAFRCSEAEFVKLSKVAIEFGKSRRLITSVDRSATGFVITVHEGEMPDVATELSKLKLGESTLLKLPKERHAAIRSIASRINANSAIKLTCRIEEDGIRVTRVAANDQEALLLTPTMMKTRDQQSKYQFERLLNGEDAYEIEVTPRELDCVRNLACKFGRRNGMRVSVRQLSIGAVRIMALERVRTV